MSTDKPPEPAPRSFADFWAKHKSTLMPIVTALVVALVSSVLTYLGAPPRVVEIVREIIKVVPIQAPPADGDDFAPTQGWVPDEAAIVENLDPARTEQFGATPAGKAALGDEDVYLWRAVRKVAKLNDSQYPNVNQQNVGCCVGCGWKHSADIVQATAILSGQPFEWQPVAVEAIYGGSRVEVGGGRISGDGSVGAWAAKWCKERGGLVPMKKYPSADLTQFSPARAREWGKRGVPDDLEADAKSHPVKGVALVRSWSEAKRAIQQGYPVAVCSDQGFTMSRDSTGRARPQGTWMHCLSLIAVRGAPNEGGFLLNSWGDSAHTGPVWPADAPVAGFWADANVIDRMLRQNDSFALSDVQGFPARKLDWLIRAAPKPRPELFAEMFALAP